MRQGIRHDGTELLGRDEAIRVITAMLARHRVVSIVGAGGLGKTRLAHVVGERSELPIVQFVELAGVSSPEDVVAEVGFALGVRDSVAGRIALTATQRSDVRVRLAQQLDRPGTMLILDNCEHLADQSLVAVSDSVASTSHTSHTSSNTHTTRYRILETVHEFGPMHLSGVGEGGEARAAHQRRALDFCRRVMPHIHGAAR